MFSEMVTTQSHLPLLPPPPPPPCHRCPSPPLLLCGCDLTPTACMPFGDATQCRYFVARCVTKAPRSPAAATVVSSSSILSVVGGNPQTRANDPSSSVPICATRRCTSATVCTSGLQTSSTFALACGVAAALAALDPVEAPPPPPPRPTSFTLTVVVGRDGSTLNSQPPLSPPSWPRRAYPAPASAAAKAMAAAARVSTVATAVATATTATPHAANTCGGTLGMRPPLEPVGCADAPTVVSAM
jgi:hypothetical protein